MQDSSDQTAANKAALARLKAMRKMLAEPVHEWTAAWVEHHGREQGIQQGQPELLSRQAARKFSPAAGERLAAVLAGVAEPDQLEQVGDWIIECETAGELFARFQGGSMLAETVREWTAEWVEQGREQGGQQRRQALLCRQAARKFDAAAGERLATALAGVADPDPLAQVGDWTIECERRRLSCSPASGMVRCRGSSIDLVPSTGGAGPHPSARRRARRRGRLAFVAGEGALQLSRLGEDSGNTPLCGPADAAVAPA